MLSHTRRWRIVTIGASIAFAGTLLAAPVAADEAGTDTTFEVTSSGDLTIDAPGAADLGTVEGDGELSEGMGDITVTDNRTDLFRSWSVYVESDGFEATIGEETYTIDPSQVTYDPDALGGFAGSLLDANLDTRSAETLDSGEPVIEFQTGLDLNLITGDVTWEPAIILDAAGESIPAGEYQGVITHSVVQ